MVMAYEVPLSTSLGLILRLNYHAHDNISWLRGADSDGAHRCGP